METSPGVSHLLPPASKCNIGSDTLDHIRLFDQPAGKYQCTLKRVGSQIIVRNAFDDTTLLQRGRSYKEITIHPGESFKIGASHLLVVDRAMKQPASDFHVIFGTRPRAEASQHLSAAADQGAEFIMHFLVTGGWEDACWLARAIHGVSGRRHRPYVELDPARPVQTNEPIGTLVVNLKDRELPDEVSRLLAAREPTTRLVASVANAEGEEWARKHLSALHLCAAKIPTTRPEPAEIKARMDRMFESRGAALRFDKLSKKNQAAIQRELPSEPIELRLLVERLIAIVADPGWRKRPWKGPNSRASILGMAGTTANDWFHKLCLSDPIVEAGGH
jgi:hypothetical protein